MPPMLPVISMLVPPLVLLVLLRLLPQAQRRRQLRATYSVELIQLLSSVPSLSSPSHRPSLRLEHHVLSPRPAVLGAVLISRGWKSSSLAVLISRITVPKFRFWSSSRIHNIPATPTLRPRPPGPWAEVGM